jgi:hypothetical protein
VVPVGVTVVQPVAGSLPIPGAMLTLVEFDTFQQSDDDPPVEMTVGDAVKLMMLGTAPPPTVTVTAAVTDVVLSAPVAVRV